MKRFRKSVSFITLWVRFNEFIRPFSKGKGRISIYEKEEILLAKNDKILLDGILDSRVEENIPSNQRDEAFEYLAYQQVLKDYDLSKEELLSGSVDGKDDGGIDAIYIFVNGHLITDITTTFWPKSNGELDIYLFTCKHRDSFKQEPINSLIASIEEQYVVLVKLRDYYRFITNTDGKLRKYLFDSNVRDFMGLTSVNEDILFFNFRFNCLRYFLIHTAIS